MLVVVVVTAGLLAVLLAERSVVDIRPGRSSTVCGRWSPASIGTTIRPVILVFDNGYDYSFVAAVLVLQQPVNDPVYVTVWVGAAGLQRYRIWPVAVALLFVWISRRHRRRRRRRYRSPISLPGRVLSFRHGGRRTTVLW